MQPRRSSIIFNGGKTVYAGYSGSSLLGAGSAVIADGTIGAGGTATTVIETYWSGSLAGVVDVVAGNQTGAYIDPSNLTSTQITAINTGATATANPYGGGVAITGSITTTTAVPDVAFSDSYQGTIAKELATASFSGTNTHVGSYTSIASLAAACAGSTIIDAGTSGNAKDAGFVGIVPFQWVIGNISTSAIKSSITNVSQQAARGLITGGFVPQAYLTGSNSTADTANYFYLVGRNEDSGTRIGAYSEAQFGVTATPVQFAVTLTGTAAGSPVSSTAKYPVTPLNTEPAIVWNTAGHSGYASGGNVATALDGTENSAALPTFTGKSSENTGSTYFMGYLGVTDAASAVGGGGKALTYNGVPFSLAAVQNGQYTFWTYEHVYRLASISGTTLGTIADGIADNVYLADADVAASDGTHSTTSGTLAGGILDNTTSAVLVYRSVNEGGPISNY